MPKKKELPHGRRLPAAVTRGKPCPLLQPIVRLRTEPMGCQPGPPRHVTAWNRTE
jgi:hypothetical protein